VLIELQVISKHKRRLKKLERRFEDDKPEE
jgi:hypothetical protein